MKKVAFIRVVAVGIAAGAMLSVGASAQAAPKAPSVVVSSSEVAGSRASAARLGDALASRTSETLPKSKSALRPETRGAASVVIRAIVKFAKWSWSKIKYYVSKGWTYFKNKWYALNSKVRKAIEWATSLAVGEIFSQLWNYFF